MHPESRVWVAGHQGMVGSAVLRRLRAAGYSRLLTRGRAGLDLRDGAAVEEFFARERPEHVFLCAARVGGIAANASRPAEFIRDNLAIQTNVIHGSWRSGVRSLLFLGSSCIYPRACPQPMKEEHLLTGPLEPTNRPYALAKIAGIEMCWSYNRQYATRYLAAMPTNLFGPGDHYDLESSHVLPALIRRMHEAKVARAEKVVAWGSGSPMREFLWSEDLADALVFLMELPEARRGPLYREDVPPLVNVGSGREIRVRDLAGLVGEVVGFGGTIAWDASRPDGTPRKRLDSSRISSLGWTPRTGLREGIARAYADFLERSA